MTDSAQTQALPSAESFLASFGLQAKPAAIAAVEQANREQVQAELAASGVSKELRDLLIQYCSAMISAFELEQVDFRALGKRLGTHPEHLQECALHLNQKGTLWNEVLQVRIKKASAAKIFRDSSWEQLEALAVNKLVALAEKNMIRDAGELLAIASHARKANTAIVPNGGGSTVNINIGGDSMDGGDNGLPAAGAKMTIDLSPRVAKALEHRGSPGGIGGERVIDGQMLSAKELRSALSQKQEPADEDSSQETQDFEGVRSER